MSSPTHSTAASERQAETTQAIPKFWVAYADWLRTVALFLVVWVHMASPYLYGSTLTPEFVSYWWSANLGMALARPGVPLFIMLSGVLMLAPHKVNEPISQFLRKRLGRLVLPFIFWSIAYLGWRMWSRHETFTVFQALREIIAGTLSPHFWFMHMIAGLFLITPVLRYYTSTATRQNLAYALRVGIFGTFILPFVARWIGIEIKMLEYWPLAGYVVYFLLGYYLHPVQLPRMVQRSLPWLTLIIGGLTAYATGILTARSGGVLDDTYYKFLTPNVALMSILLFCWLKELPYQRWMDKIWGFRAAIQAVSDTSFSVYLSHIILCELCQTGHLGFIMIRLPISPWITVPGLSLIILAVAVLIIKMIRLIPGGKFIAT